MIGRLPADLLTLLTEPVLGQLPLNELFGIGIDVDIDARLFQRLDAAHHLRCVGLVVLSRIADDLEQLLISARRQVEPQADGLEIIHSQRKIAAIIGGPQLCR